MSKRAGTVGNILIQEILPEEFRRPDLVLDKKTLSGLLSNIAKKYPERYRDISFKLNQIGKESAFRSGGNSFGLKHLRKANAAVALQRDLQKSIAGILADDKLSDKQKESKIIELAGKLQEAQPELIFKESMDEKNPLAIQLIGAGRGNKLNLASLRGSDVLYQDHRGRIIPIPVLKSYSQGLTPAEYWAGTYGARQGVMMVKFATQDAGYFSKQLNQLAHRVLVTDVDDDKEPDTLIGLPVDTDDNDSEGALLAAPILNYKRNTIITPKILNDIKNNGIKRILVRSPAVRGSKDGGVYARDVGVREFNRLPVRGEFVGLTAAQALGEPLSQSQLCLAKGTQVRMADWSSKPIENIVPGDMVMGSDINGVISPTRVINTYNNGIKPCYKTIFRVAKTKETISLESTLDHKLLAKIRKWARPAQLIEHGILPVGTKCVGYSAKMPSNVINDFGKYDPFAKLLGILIGDGCYTNSVKQIYWSCFEPMLISELEDYLYSLGLKAIKHKDGYYRISQINDSAGSHCEKTGRWRAVARNPIKAKLIQLGMYGKYAHEKILADEILQWNNQAISELIGGLIATDGSVYITKSGTVGLSLCSTSKLLLEQIKQLLLTRFAIFAGPIDCQTKGRKHGLHQFAITRKEQLIRVLENIAIPGRKYSLLKTAVELFKQKENKPSTEYFHRIEQTFIGDVATFDIEVDNTAHLFLLSNGLIVSNSAKHTGGIAGAAKLLGGFDYIDQLVQVPKTFKGGAAHTTNDGMVQDISPAPAGGTYITVDGIKHYVAAGFDLKVKKGDTVEAGDVLSEGVPNPSIITKYKGIGEGRRYFINAFKDAMVNSNIKANRRNIELISKGLIDHIRLTEESGEHSPDDIVSYSAFESSYAPRKGAVAVSPTAAVGRYLEKPYLHYTIGTKIKPSMLQNFKDFGIKEVIAHDDEPIFEPEMIRGMANLQHDPDFITRMFGSGLKESLLDAVHMGGKSTELGTSFVPGRARAVDFGRVGIIKPPKAPSVINNNSILNTNIKYEN